MHTVIQKTKYGCKFTICPVQKKPASFAIALPTMNQKIENTRLV